MADRSVQQATAMFSSNRIRLHFRFLPSPYHFRLYFPRMMQGFALLRPANYAGHCKGWGGGGELITDKINEITTKLNERAREFSYSAHFLPCSGRLHSGNDLDLC